MNSENNTRKQLLILRHAKSERESDTGHDFDRVLAARGHKDAPRMGRWMKKRDLAPDLVLCSPAMRARQTAEAVTKELAVSQDRIRFDDRLFLAGRDTLLQVVRECPEDARRVLLIGHNPGLDELLTFLSQNPPPRSKTGKLLTTATLADLETDHPWQTLDTGQAQLNQLVRPKDLR